MHPPIHIRIMFTDGELAKWDDIVAFSETDNSIRFRKDDRLFFIPFANMFYYELWEE